MKTLICALAAMTLLTGCFEGQWQEQARECEKEKSEAWKIRDKAIEAEREADKERFKAERKRDWAVEAEKKAVRKARNAEREAEKKASAKYAIARAAEDAKTERKLMAEYQVKVDAYKAKIDAYVAGAKAFYCTKQTPENICKSLMRREEGRAHRKFNDDRTVGWGYAEVLNKKGKWARVQWELYVTQYTIALSFRRSDRVARLTVDSIAKALSGSEADLWEGYIEGYAEVKANIGAVIIRGTALSETSSNGHAALRYIAQRMRRASLVRKASVVQWTDVSAWKARPDAPVKPEKPEFWWQSIKRY